MNKWAKYSLIVGSTSIVSVGLGYQLHMKKEQRSFHEPSDLKAASPAIMQHETVGADFKSVRVNNSLSNVVEVEKVKEIVREVSSKEPRKQFELKEKWDSNWDHRDDEQWKTQKVRHIVFIRHGQYNMEGRTDNQRTLTPLGVEQAIETGKRLAELNLPISRFISSTMSRAMQTSENILNQLKTDTTVNLKQEVQYDPILCEGAPIKPEPDVGAWHPSMHYETDGMRIESAFRKYVHRASVSMSSSGMTESQSNKDILDVIVCHANVIRYFVCRVLQVRPDAWLRFSLKHGSMTWVTIYPDGTVSVRSVGDAGHISPGNISS